MRWIYLSLAAVAFAGGLVTFWLPIPLGVPLFLLSVPVLMRYSGWWRGRLLKLAERIPPLRSYLENMRMEGEPEPQGTRIREHASCSEEHERDEEEPK